MVSNMAVLEITDKRFQTSGRAQALVEEIKQLLKEHYRGGIPEMAI
jgi:hypothetical protein